MLIQVHFSSGKKYYFQHVGCWEKNLVVKLSTLCIKIGFIYDFCGDERPNIHIFFIYHDLNNIPQAHQLGKYLLGRVGNLTPRPLNFHPLIVVDLCGG